jgi:hypothetical protein
MTAGSRGLIDRLKDAAVADPEGFATRVRTEEHEARSKEVAAQSRALTVEAIIVRACEAGDLVSAVRPPRGGMMQMVPRHYWNGDDLRRRFYHCKMSLDDPFGAGFAGDKFGFIFVQKESLDRFLAGQPFSPKPAEGVHQQEQGAPEPSASGTVPVVTNSDTKARRKAGNVSFSKQDAPLLAEMHVMVKEGVSISEAARQLARSAAGGGTLESKVERLRKAYPKAYRSDQPPTGSQSTTN